MQKLGIGLGNSRSKESFISLAAVLLLAAWVLFPAAGHAQEQTVMGWFHHVSIHRPGAEDIVQYWLTDDFGSRRILEIDPALLAARGGVRALDGQRVTVRGDAVAVAPGAT